MFTHEGNSPQVVIIGGGPTGLAAALTLSRSMIRTTVIDSKEPARNGASPFVASLPGFDRRRPEDVRSAIRKDISAYPYARFIEGEVLKIESLGAGYLLSMDAGIEVSADVLLLATGMVDLFPALDGLQNFWGHSIINCPFCHGIEWQNHHWGIYADRPEVLAAAEIYRNWSDRITYFIGPDAGCDTDRLNALKGLGIAVEMSLPERVAGNDDTLAYAVTPDGRQIDLDCMLIYPRQKLPDLIEGLNPSLSDAGHVEVDEGYRSSLPGIYAAGDLIYQGHQNTPTALHMGNMAAASIVTDLCFNT